MYTPDDTALCLDVMLGGIVSPLRMVGYDTLYALERGIESDAEIIDLADREHRLLLTRDREVAKSAENHLLLIETEPIDQLRELADAGFVLELTEPIRCSRCNGPLGKVEAGPGPTDGPDPADEAVWQCRSCAQFYWKGSHWANLRERLDSL